MHLAMHTYFGFSPFSVDYSDINFGIISTSEIYRELPAFVRTVNVTSRTSRPYVSVQSKTGNFKTEICKLYTNVNLV